MEVQIQFNKNETRGDIDTFIRHLKDRHIVCSTRGSEKYNKLTCTFPSDLTDKEIFRIVDICDNKGCVNIIKILK